MFVRNICSVIYKSHVCSIISCSKTGCIELIDEFPHILSIPVIPIIPTAIIITGYNSRCNPCSLTKRNPALTANEYLSFPFRIYFGLLYVSCPEIGCVSIYDKDIRTYVRWNLVFEDWKKKIEQVFDFVYFYFVLHIARRTLILMVFRRSKPLFWWFSYFFGHFSYFSYIYSIGMNSYVCSIISTFQTWRILSGAHSIPHSASRTPIMSSTTYLLPFMSPTA